MSTARLIASLDDAQALTGVCTPARAPTLRPMLAAGALEMSIGIVNGLTRRRPVCPAKGAVTTRS